MNVFSAIFGEKNFIKTKDAWESSHEHFEWVNEIINVKEAESQLRQADFIYMPYLFRDQFPGVSDEQISLLTQAGILIYSSLLYFDAFIDGQVEFDTYKLYHRNFEWQKAIRILTHLYGDSHRFWDYYKKYNKEYIDAIKLEREHEGIIKDYSQNEYEKVSRGKAAVAKLATAGLGCLSGDYELADKFEATQDYFAQANQILDDLKDWRDDYKRKNFSPLLTEIFVSSGKEIGQVDEEEIKDYLFNNNLDLLYLEKSLRACDKAKATALGCDPWIRSIGVKREGIERLRDDLVKIRGNIGYYYTVREFEGIDRLAEKAGYVISKSLKYLVEQKKGGYRELVHWMIFPHNSGFCGEEELQEGYIFQKAFLYNLFTELKDMGCEINSTLLDYDEDFYKQSKHEYLPYSWGYFKYLPDLSPDIDTLSEFIKLYNHKKSHHSEFENIIEKVFQSCLTKDGCYETWIIPKNELEKYSEIAIALSKAEECWGMEPDPEVNANFMLALSKLNYEKYKQQISDGLSWILQKQIDNSYWESTWYSGRYYGSYICARLFRELGYKSKETENTLRYLLENQNLNGSYGLNDGNPQDTAFAISTIIDLTETHHMEYNIDIIKKSIEYLIKSFDSELGMWYSCEFIKMYTGRVTGKGVVLKYASCTLTTAICLYGLAKGMEKLSQEGCFNG